MAPLWQDWTDRRAAKAARGGTPARGFILEPMGRPPGSFARGRRVAAGSFLLDGKVLESPDPFAARPPSEGFAAALHGWGWLDDLAACGEASARDAARRWLADWLDRCSNGAGPGWHADLAGRRLLRWVEHGVFLVAGAGADLGRAYLGALGQHAAFLARRWQGAPAGLPRVEALTGWAMAGLMLDGLQAQAEPALAALTDHAGALIGADGGIPSRCPEELLWIAAHLGWCRETALEAGHPVPEGLEAALVRAARALKALRHADGGLPRFHGGGAGPEGLIERTLAAAPRDPVRPVRAMGFARMDGGRTSVIVDAAAPPPGLRGQAATLAFELTSGRRPVVVGCGSGAAFGADWDAAGRSTAAASTLELDGQSSARFVAALGGQALGAGPVRVGLHRSDEPRGTALMLAHDGWVASHGLTHTRALDLSADGRALLGEDGLAALAPADKVLLDRAQAGTGGRGLAFTLRFHLHPEVEATPDFGGAGVRLVLGSGEVWLFRFDGAARLGLEPSVWLEPGLRAPRPCRQIVLRGQLTGASARINWTLAKSQDTPLVIRDTGGAADATLPPDFYDRD